MIVDRLMMLHNWAYEPTRFIEDSFITRNLLGYLLTNQYFMGLDRGKRCEMDANEWHLHRNLEMFTEKNKGFHGFNGFPPGMKPGTGHLALVAGGNWDDSVGPGLTAVG
jgi:hypothetical protein